MNEENWISQRITPYVTDVDRKGLDLAHKQENKLIKQGYRWYKLNVLHRILVPFGDDGKPTKKALEKIRNYKEHLGII